MVQIFVLAKNQTDRIEQHVAAIPMLERLFEMCVDSADEGTCWYREEPGYRGSQYSMTLVSKQPKGGAVKGKGARRERGRRERRDIEMHTHERSHESTHATHHALERTGGCSRLLMLCWGLLLRWWLLAL